MTKNDNQTIAADLLADMSPIDEARPDELEQTAKDGFDSLLSQSLSNDLHRDIQSITLRLTSNTALTGDLKIVDRGIYSLMESLVVIAQTYSETEEELDEMLASYTDLMKQISDKNTV